MHIIAVGRLRPGPERDLFNRYQVRLRPPPKLIEVPEQRGTAAEVRHKEGAALLAALPRAACLVPLDLGGRSLDSEAFALRLAQWSHPARVVSFVIGGAEGLDAAVINRADDVLSLGPMTWPHFLARAMLAEQLYRAQTILQRHPYHRSGRP